MSDGEIEAGQEPESLIVEMVVDRASVDVALDRLWSGGTTGIEERDLTGQPDSVVLRAGFASSTVADATMASMGAHARILDRVVPDGSEFDRANEFAQPVMIGTHLLIQPARGTTAGQSPDGDWTDRSSRVITIDAGRSFGHGGHPTTRLALDAIAEIMETPDADVASVLDVGCGSGVLAIAAVTLGAAHAVAIDISPDAIDATRLNARANNVEAHVEVVHGELSELEGRFSLVVANLEAPTLETLAAPLLQAVAPGGWLVLSGVLERRWTSLWTHFQAGRQVSAAVLQGWIGPVLRAGGPTRTGF